MTDMRGADAPPAEQVPADSPSRRSPFKHAAPAAAIAVAIVTVVAAYLISHTNAPKSPSHPSPAASATLPAPAYPTPALTGALSPETGPDGMAWQWISRTASVDLATPMRGWIAFRAVSPRLLRTLDFAGSAGEHLSVRIGTAPGVYLAGPLRAGRVRLKASPATAAKPGKPPPLSVFLSELRVMPNPVAVIPGAGFWSTESSGGVVFNWLRGTGALDIYSPHTPSGRLWVTFIARSLGTQRVITIPQALTTKLAIVTTSARTVTVGPFRLVGGRARVFLHSTPGPQRYGADPRMLSVQLASLGGYTTAEA